MEVSRTNFCADGEQIWVEFQPAHQGAVYRQKKVVHGGFRGTAAAINDKLRLLFVNCQNEAAFRADDSVAGARTVDHQAAGIQVAVTIGL